MMLADASSHYSLLFRLAVFHLWWSWTRVLPLSVSNRRVQIFPGGICLVSADRIDDKPSTTDHCWSFQKFLYAEASPDDSSACFYDEY